MTNIQRVVDFLSTYPGHGKTSIQKLADRIGFGVTQDDIRAAKRIIREQETPTITEYDQFLTEQGIKEEDVSSVWHKGKHFSVNRRVQAEIFDEEKFKKRIEGYKVPKVAFETDGNFAQGFAVINMYDAHVDKLSFTGEGGKRELFSNLEVLWGQFLELLQEVLIYKPHTIVLPIGNDFFTTNGREQATRAGTPQHRTTHWQDSFEAGIEFYRRCIDTIRKYANCYIVNIPGNHDHDLVLALGSVIRVLYEDTSGVTLNLSKNSRKYATIGECLLGFGHGKTEHKRVKDLPTAMAIENQSFSTAKYRVFFLGDKHHKEEYSSLTKLEHNGVEIKFLRACTSEDEWHNEMLWIGARKSVSAMVIADNGSKLRQLENFF